MIDLCERVIARRCAGSATIELPGGYPIAQEHRASAIFERLIATYAGW